MQGDLTSLGLRLDGRGLDVQHKRGCLVEGDTLRILLNSHHEAVSFVLPPCIPSVRRPVVFDSARPGFKSEDQLVTVRELPTLTERSLMLMRRRKGVVEAWKSR